MLKSQQELNFSQYTDLYDKLIPQDHLFRKINELIDFSFIREELKDKYCPDNGRTAEDPEYLFKFLFLKCLHPMSDVDLVERALYDLSYKYFLGLNPEDEVINASTLSKFRKLRLKDTELLDLLIEKTVQIAMDKGIIESKSIIVDATHTKSRYNSHPIREVLQEHARRLRKEVYSVDEKTKNMMPAKNEEDSIEKEVEYCERLLKTIEGMPVVPNLPRIIEKMNLLKETMEDTKEEMYKSTDEDAKTGYKSADTSFFGYKTHIAMTPERIITAATVTSGEKHDGKELQKLVEKSQANGIEVEAVIGDGAYSEKENIEYCEKNNIKLASKLSKFVTHGNSQRNDNFEYNKDAGMYVCKAGHMAIRKVRQGSIKTTHGNTKVECYYFDVEKCKHCKYKEGCYKEGSKFKTYSVKIKDDIHIKHMDYMETEEFKELYSERYKIEAKNAELKSRFGYDSANACGKNGITIQGASALFLANIKRIIK